MIGVGEGEGDGEGEGVAPGVGCVSVCEETEGGKNRIRQKALNSRQTAAKERRNAQDSHRIDFIPCAGFAALPPHNAERLCLSTSVASDCFGRGFASTGRGTASC